MNYEEKPDINEDDIGKLDLAILKILLKDKTTKKNILWCTTDYEELGAEYEEKKQIEIEQITGIHSQVIQPRISKAKEVQEKRSKDKGEVMTPSWICNEQISKVDEAWFGRPNVFNVPNGKTWITNRNPILFTGKKTWKSYVLAKRLEMACGEAPYIASRYDTTTGEIIPVADRIGMFDRKMRIVTENCTNQEEWIHWSLKALKSIYAFEWQGDSVLLARENVLYDYMDYYRKYFKANAPISLLKKVANIISWNIWQMDGLKYVVPFSCHDIKKEPLQYSLFEDIEYEMIPCQGCANDNIYQHTGIYCRIYDWTGLNKSIPFISLINKGEM